MSLVGDLRTLARDALSGKDSHLPYSTILQDRLNAQLKRFINNPLSFRSTMRTTNAIIVGSFVLLYIFAELPWNSGDLDLLVCYDAFETLVEYLIFKEGYSPVAEDPRKVAHPYVLNRHIFPWFILIISL